VLDPIYYAVSAVMWAWHRLFALLLDPAGGAAWALSVVFLVLTLRALMIGPVLASLRSARTARALGPQLADLRRRHAGDPEALVRETRALQAAHGVSPLGGCLPALVQLPVFLGLLHVLHSFDRPGLTPEQNAALANYVFPPEAVRSFLEARLFGVPLSSYVAMPQDVLDAYGGPVERWEVVAVALPLVVLAAVATHVTARHSLARGALEAPAAAVLRWTPWIFPLGVVVGGLFFPFPVAILLYWLTNSTWTLVQQWLVHRRAGTDPPVPPSAAATPPAADATEPDRPAPHLVAGRGASGRSRRHSSGHRPSRRRRR
jgi:YidC/Oxa1 family membrane protein insertase